VSVADLGVSFPERRPPDDVGECTSCGLVQPNLLPVGRFKSLICEVCGTRDVEEVAERYTAYMIAKALTGGASLMFAGSLEEVMDKMKKLKEGGEPS
jgi:hypothetical protein